MLVIQQEKEPLREFAMRMFHALYSDMFHFVEGDYNGIPLRVNTSSTLRSVFMDYKQQVRAHMKASRSPEDPSKVTLSGVDREVLQSMLDELLDELEIIDMSNHHEVIHWLIRFIPFTRERGLNIPNDKVVDRFKANGYLLKDKENKAFNRPHWLIANCIGQLERFGWMADLQRMWLRKWLASTPEGSVADEPELPDAPEDVTYYRNPTGIYHSEATDGDLDD